jgi:prepilin-type N-terminal cleavage/methylation domain-containing protein
MSTRKTKSGFTLIELLVVISIMGLMSSIVITSVQDARRKARNTAVQSAVVQYLKAFELMKQDNRTIPTPGTFCLGNNPSPTDTTSCGSGFGVVTDPTFNTAISLYIQGAPNPMTRTLQWGSPGNIKNLGAHWSITTDLKTLSVSWILEGNTSVCAAGAIRITNGAVPLVALCQLTYTLSI